MYVFLLLVLILTTQTTSQAYAQAPVSEQLPAWAALTSPNITSIGSIINAITGTLFGFAGLALLLMLMYGGFQMLTAASDPHRADAGKQRITMALAGLLVMVFAFWIIQIIEVMFGFNIFNFSGAPRQILESAPRGPGLN